MPEKRRELSDTCLDPLDQQHGCSVVEGDVFKHPPVAQQGAGQRMPTEARGPEGRMGETRLVPAVTLSLRTQDWGLRTKAPRPHTHRCIVTSAVRPSVLRLALLSFHRDNR
jgi:hypothetical protein